MLRPGAVRRSWLPLSLALAATSTLFACSSAGPYGYSRTYSPLAAEEAALQGSERYDPVMARRLPGEWHGKKLDVFGIVQARAEGRDGLADLTLSVRRLAARNLCEDASDDTCRVTVGDQELARLHVLVQLGQSDSLGNGVQPRSLVRVVGKLEEQTNKEDGSDVLLATYYRHWPAAEFVTEQARSYLRR